MVANARQIFEEATLPLNLKLPALKKRASPTKYAMYVKVKYRFKVLMMSSSYKRKNTSVKAQKNTLIQMYSDERLLMFPPFQDAF